MKSERIYARKHLILITYLCHLGLDGMFKMKLFCSIEVNLGDNCIQNFHLGRYIVGYTVGNLVLCRRASGAVKHDFRTYIRHYTSPNEKVEYGYPHSNALLQSYLRYECCKPYKAARRPKKVT